MKRVRLHKDDEDNEEHPDEGPVAPAPPVSDQAKQYDNIKVNYHKDFDIVQYATDVMDTTRPYLVVLHRHGKAKERKHWHVVGKMLPGTDIHLKMATKHPSRDKSHPDFTGGKGSKAVQKKAQLYDKGAFNYVLKPKEYESHSDMVIATNLKNDEIIECAAESKKYHDASKNAITDILCDTMPRPNETPESFHFRLLEIVMEKLSTDTDKDHPNGRVAGPWITHAVRMAVYKKQMSFHPYIIKFYA
jgi:hypothetical protein